MQGTTGKTRRQWRRAIPFALLLLLGAGGGFAVWASAGSTAASQMGPEGVPVRNVPDVAPATSTLNGQSVDGVMCQTQAKEVVKYHIHSYVHFYVNGSEKRLPAGVGITQPPLIEHFSTGPFYDVGLYDCLYWIHTHAYDGIVHIEAPLKATFTLGQLFSVWNQPLSSDQVGPAKGGVVVFENGRRMTGDPRMVPILPHSVIQIDVGTPVVAFHPFIYKVTGGCGQGTSSCSSAQS
jgi:hypothetical protein